ncbi:HlyC/CorC family transporter [bacterium]|nr:HlyC/CorC family transporter [bacterium]
MEPQLTSVLYFATAAFFISLLLFGIFSFIETSITALRLFKLREFSQETKKYATLFESLEKSPQSVLTTILIATSLVNVFVAALSSTIMEKLFASIGFGRLGFTLGVGFAAIAILIFGEIIPKNLAKTRGDKIFKSTLWLTNLTYLVLRPVVPMLIRFSDFLVQKIGGKKTVNGSQWVSSEKEIEFLIEHIDEKGLIESEKSEMLRGIFDLGKTPVKKIMIPSIDIASIDIATPTEETLHLFSKYQFTRLPAYEEKTDNIIGMIHFKDVFMNWSQKKSSTLKELMRPTSFIPESIKINQLLKELREKHQHMAMVINEYGSITGLITLEDIIEEIVGEISDEYESTQEKIISLKQGGWLIDATVPLSEVSEIMNIKINAKDALTLGGFLTEKLQHIPKKGDRLLYEGFYFQIQKATEKRVLQVLIFEEKNPKTTDAKL